MSVAKRIVSVHDIEMTLLLSQKIPAVFSERSWSQCEGALILLHRAQRRCLGWMEAGRWKQELLNTLLIFLGFPSSAGSFPEHMCQRALLTPVPAERASRGLPWTDAKRDWELAEYIFRNIQQMHRSLKLYCMWKHYFLKYFYIFSYNKYRNMAFVFLSLTFPVFFCSL